jgi:antitoxin component of RelBE/YafQ-DinJ toxin-antitoxin module
MKEPRTGVHNANVNIRVSEEIKRLATEAARRQGMNLSEAVRQFLRELAKQGGDQ